MTQRRYELSDFEWSIIERAFAEGWGRLGIITADPSMEEPYRRLVRLAAQREGRHRRHPPGPGPAGRRSDTRGGDYIGY